MQVPAAASEDVVVDFTVVAVAVGTVEAISVVDAESSAMQVGVSSPTSQTAPVQQ